MFDGCGLRLDIQVNIQTLVSKEIWVKDVDSFVDTTLLPAHRLDYCAKYVLVASIVRKRN